MRPGCHWSGNAGDSSKSGFHKWRRWKSSTFWHPLFLSKIATFEPLIVKNPSLEQTSYLEDQFIHNRSSIYDVCNEFESGLISVHFYFSFCDEAVKSQQFNLICQSVWAKKNCGMDSLAAAAAEENRRMMALEEEHHRRRMAAAAAAEEEENRRKMAFQAEEEARRKVCLFLFVYFLC